MPNLRAVQRLTDAMLTGKLVHPGDPANNVAPVPIVLPFQRAASRPKEMTDLMDATAKLWSEAIVALIEADSEIVPREEAVVMRRAVGEGPPAPSAIPVFCRCDRQQTDPLAVLTTPHDDRIVIDGPALIRGLTKRAVACPHERG